MIENFEIDQSNNFANGTFENNSFSLPPKVVNGQIVALTETECLEILDWRKTTNARAEKDTYKMYRMNEYPPIGDQLDALWKGGDAATEMLAKVQAVKQKYPKAE
jgi:hypothetical protein